jgi:phosphoribosylamine--glycine ligase
VKVLVLGSGGKEHAIVWKLSRSKLVNEIYCWPGNAGIAEIAECIDVSPHDVSSIIDFVKYEWIDLTIAGSEKLLLQGIVDDFRREGCKIIGPDRNALSLSVSRVTAKELMRRHRIPTAEFKVFASYLHAQDYVRLKGAPIVIKTDGKTEKNTVVVARSVEEASDVLKRIMADSMFGDTGKQVIIEESLGGTRASFVVLTDGNVILPLASLYRENEGFPDTSRTVAFSSRAVSPAPDITGDFESRIMQTIMRPLLKAVASDGISYRGFISIDFIMDGERLFVDELNCCLGQLEAQTILPRLKTDLVEIMFAVTEGRLSDIVIEKEPVSSVCVVMATKENPPNKKKGIIIHGLEKAKQIPDTFIFHENTSFRNAETITPGGRALSVSAIGPDMPSARKNVDQAIETIHFEGS